MMQSDFQKKINNFFSNRNGIDELGVVFLFLNIVFSVLWYFFKEMHIFLVLEIICLAYLIFRIFSKNVYQRQKENMAFVNFFKKKTHIRLYVVK